MEKGKIEVSMPSNSDILFEVMTPLGFRVRVMKDYWELIVSIKHPVMAGREQDVKADWNSPTKFARASRTKTFICFTNLNEQGVGSARFPRELTKEKDFDHHISDRRDQGRSAGMAQVKVYYDREGNTLTVWFGNPADEFVAEETGEEIFLMKDREGKVIGFEKLNFTAQSADAVRVAFETVAA